MQTGSSVLVYNSRFAHLEPLAEARFKKESVDCWLENIQKTRSQNSARELVRLAKKFWEFGLERGAWKGISPFGSVELMRMGGYNSTCLSNDLIDKYVSPKEITKILNLSSNHGLA